MCFVASGMQEAEGKSADKTGRHKANSKTEGERKGGALLDRGREENAK